MSSCHNESKTIKKDHHDKRVAIIENELREFFRGVINNLCIPDGVGGRIDMALTIKRRPIIARIMKELADEIEKEG